MTINSLINAGQILADKHSPYDGIDFLNIDVPEEINNQKYEHKLVFIRRLEIGALSGEGKYFWEISREQLIQLEINPNAFISEG